MGVKILKVKGRSSYGMAQAVKIQRFGFPSRSKPTSNEQSACFLINMISQQ